MQEAEGKKPMQERPPALPRTFSRRRTIVITTLLAPGAGLAASLLSVLMMGILRVTAGIPTPVELFGDFVLKHIDVHTFIRLLRTYAPNSKTAPLGLALVSMIGLGTALSWLYAALVRIPLPTNRYRPGRREWLTALACTVLMTLTGIVLFWDELRQNYYGLTVDWSRLVTACGLLIDFSVYAVALCLTYRAILPQYQPPGVRKAAHDRRQLLTRGGVIALSIGAAAGTLGVLREYLNRYTSYDGMKTAYRNTITHPITPNHEHYVVTKNTIDPTPDIALWRLEVGGLVKKPGTYTYKELQKMPSTSRAITLECIANGIGDHLIGTAIWQGVPLRTLLERHQLDKQSAKYIAFYSVDGYNMSLPLDEVLAVDAMLAWRMNGIQLPVRHGYPLRVLIPGRYGEQNPKWLTRVDFTDHFVHGLYSSQGWYNGPLHTMSRIDYPRDHVRLGQVIEVGGIAFAGNRGIQNVDISVDGGIIWQRATLDPPLSPDSWVLWKWQWRPRTRGSYTLVVRATDGTGAVQTSRKQGTVPNGATGYHEVPVIVD